jgi:hypothetical protein
MGKKLIDQGLQEFPRDCMMLFVAGIYFESFCGEQGRRTANRIFDEMKTCNPPFDLKFQVYMRERASADQRKTPGIVDGEQVHVLESAEFQNWDRRAKKGHFLALSAIREFWAGVVQRATLATLSDSVLWFGTHCYSARECYSFLAANYPRNRAVLRAYCQFLISVVKDFERGQAILSFVEECKFDPI